MEKINIYVPERIAGVLESDARQFELFKKDRITINMNRYLNMLIAGYYDNYTEQHKKMNDQIAAILERNGFTGSKALRSSAESITKIIFSPELSKKKGIISRKISLKPTVSTEPILLYLNSNLDGDSLSQYFCRMFTEYAQNPLNIRERIVFKDSLDLILSACEKNQSLSFVTSRSPELIQEVLPYNISVGKDELFNYLLCQKKNPDTGIYEAATYRLCRLQKIRRTGTAASLTEDVHRHLDMMKLYGPQYTINDDEESCVQLTETGALLFNRIYFGRPTVDRIELRNGKYYYYFKCSKNQLFQYFRRFSNGHAVVLYPESLVHDIYSFHREALNAYEKDPEKAD